MTAEQDYGTQQMHKLAKPIDEGEDENGPYHIIPLAMVRGGKRKPYKVYTKPMRHLLSDSTPTPRGWYKPKTPDSERVRARTCCTEAVLTSPYGGFCPVNCAYCYVNNGTRGYRATGLPVVYYNYPAAMEKWLGKMMVSGAAYITPFSEAFHPLEEVYHVTQDLAEVFAGEGLPMFFTTRKRPPEWAVELLLENPYSYVHFSVNTSNPDHFHRLSPGGYSLDEVYEDIEWLHDNDVFVGVQCNPIVAGVTSLEEIVALVYEVADCGANHVTFKFVEQVANNRAVIIKRMHQRGLPHVDVFDNLFSQVIGGVYTIQEEVRVEWLDVLLEETRRAEITMSLCHEYFDDGMAGTNLAPYYTTADQCHGRGVPLYFRPEPGAPFEPLPGCYRKGCLYCLEYGTEACGNDKLLEADALQYKDMRTIQLAGRDDWWNLLDSCIKPEWLPGADHLYGNPMLVTDAEQWGWDDA